MIWIKIENNNLTKPPRYDKETGLVNCHLNQDWLLKNGYEQWSDEQVQNWYEENMPSVDTSEFDLACDYFRQICSEIGALMGVSDFRGGYDDMPVFYAHESYKTNKGMQLAIAWDGCDDFCNHEASKLGIGSPEWWYKCWENYSQSNSSSGSEGNDDPVYTKTITVESPLTFELEDSQIFEKNINSYVSVSDGSTPTLTLASGSVLPSGLELFDDGLIAGMSFATSDSSTTIIVSSPGAESKEIIINWVVVEPVIFTIENTSINVEMTAGETKIINIPDIAGVYTNKGTVTYSLGTGGDFASITPEGVLTMSTTSIGLHSLEIMLTHSSTSTKYNVSISLEVGQAAIPVQSFVRSHDSIVMKEGDEIEITLTPEPINTTDEIEYSWFTDDDGAGHIEMISRSGNKCVVKAVRATVGNKHVYCGPFVNGASFNKDYEFTFTVKAVSSPVPEIPVDDSILIVTNGSYESTMDWSAKSLDGEYTLVNGTGVDRVWQCGNYILRHYVDEYLGTSCWAFFEGENAMSIAMSKVDSENPWNIEYTNNGGIFSGKLSVSIVEAQASTINAEDAVSGSYYSIDNN